MKNNFVGVLLYNYAYVAQTYNDNSVNSLSSVYSMEFM